MLLLDATQSYHNEVKRAQSNDIPQSIKDLLPRLKNSKETEVIIVSLPEATPFYEAFRLEEDLNKANVKWWIINSSLLFSGTTNELLKAKANNEIQWI